MGLEPIAPILQGSVASVEHAGPKNQRSVRELNPAFLLTEEACGRNTYRPVVQMIPDGLEPSLSWMSHQAACRWQCFVTLRDRVSSRGGRRTHKITRLSGTDLRLVAPLCLFAYPAVDFFVGEVAGPGVAPGGPRL
jgi:hypothetical protein